MKRMKIRIFSDLHLEFGDFSPSQQPCDVVVLAGDIAVGAAAVSWIERFFSGIPVVYVLGNHEFYGNRYDALYDEIRSLCQGTSIYLLENKAVVLNGVRFLGATLWTDYQLSGDRFGAMTVLRDVMNDYHRIAIGDRFRQLSPEDVVRVHMHSRSWLEKQLAESFEGKTVVVTHHAPSSRSLRGRRFKDDPVIGAAYASDLSFMMQTRQGHGNACDLWIHGHTHDSCDYLDRGTRVISNPRGYVPYGANVEFNPNLIIEF